jgi:hypothetical protein
MVPGGPSSAAAAPHQLTLAGPGLRPHSIAPHNPPHQSASGAWRWVVCVSGWAPGLRPEPIDGSRLSRLLGCAPLPQTLMRLRSRLPNAASRPALAAAPPADAVGPPGRQASPIVARRDDWPLPSRPFGVNPIAAAAAMGPAAPPPADAVGPLCGWTAAPTNVGPNTHCAQRSKNRTQIPLRNAQPRPESV